MKKLFAIVAVMGVLTFGSTQLAQAQDAPAAEQTEQAAVAPAADAAAPAAMEAAEGGIHKELKTKFIEGTASFMSLVAIALVIGLAFCIERIIYLSLAEINTKKFLAAIEAALEKGTEVVLDCSVTKIQKKADHFQIFSGKRSFSAKKVILAVGGKAAPALGTTGDGYGLARSMGHETTTIYPILTGIECGDLQKIKGVRARGTVRLFIEDRLLAEETGEIQFTEDGISGICVMNLTMHITAEKGVSVRESLQRYHLELDLAPDFSEKELLHRKSSFGILSYALSQIVSLEDIKAWRLPVRGVKGWKSAQCTAGGIRLDEIDMQTMESRIVPGFYLVGEILDVQGKCGGFNLQNAWETGIRAAQHLNEILL